MKGHSSRVPEATFRVRAFDVQPDKCLNRHHFGNECRRCADVCPVDAIRLYEGGAATGDREGERPPTPVAFDLALCIRCGACLGACPTEALVDAWSPEDGLVKNIPSRDPGPIELVCPLNVTATTPDGTIVQSRVPDALLLGTPRCLAAIAPRQLLELSQLGRRAVWLHDAACLTCPLERTTGQTEANVSEANSWLVNYGRAAVIHSYRGAGATLSAPEWRQMTVIAAPAPRRTFLKMALGLEVGYNRRGDSLPQKRQLLLQTLDRLDRSPVTLQTESLPMTNVVIDGERCSACGLCARICITGAMQFVSDHEAFGLFFDARRCLDCDLCAQACPETVISFTPELPGTEWAHSGASRRHAGTLQRCRDCPAMIASETGEECCFVCRRRKLPAFLAGNGVE